MCQYHKYHSCNKRPYDHFFWKLCPPSSFCYIVLRVTLLRTSGQQTCHSSTSKSLACSCSDSSWSLFRRGRPAAEGALVPSHSPLLLTYFNGSDFTFAYLSIACEDDWPYWKRRIAAARKGLNIETMGEPGLFIGQASTVHSTIPDALP